MVGPSREFADFQVGESASLDREITAADVERFAALTGDINPVHMEPEYAKATGIGGRIVHGMLTAGYVSTAVGTLLPGPGALWLSESFSFRAPVRIGDRITVTVTITRISPATRVLVLDVGVVNQHDRTVLDGQAQVHVLDRLSGVPGMIATTGTAVVTGSSRGIGAAIAARLGAEGIPVVVNYRTDDAGAAATVASIVDSGGRAAVRQADVSDPGAVADLFAFAAETFGPVQALVNNAGGPTDPRALAETSWADVERHLDSHVRASFLCTEAVLPAMVERGFGRIVNITSQAAYGTPPARMTGYVMAKAALAAFTRCVAVEAGPNGVTANAVAPGMIDTDLVADVPQRVKLAQAAQAPLRRLPGVEEVADTVAYLLGPGGAYLTGQTIHLSGGQAMN